MHTTVRRQYQDAENYTENIQNGMICDQNNIEIRPPQSQMGIRAREEGFPEDCGRILLWCQEPKGVLLLIVSHGHVHQMGWGIPLH